MNYIIKIIANAQKFHFSTRKMLTASQIRQITDNEIA